MGPTFPVYSDGFLKKLGRKNSKKRKALKAAIRRALKDDPNHRTVIDVIKKVKAKTMPTYKKLLRSP
jgi:ribosomal protein S8